MALRIRDKGNNIGPVRAKGQKTEPGEWSSLGLPDPASGSPLSLNERISRASSRAKLPSEKEWKERAALVRQKVREAERAAVPVHNNSNYRGQHDAHRKHGFGTQTNINGYDIYSGSWEYDNASGFGIIRYGNGGWYEGEWDKGKRNGHGRMLFTDGSFYFGEWVGDCVDGFGLWEYADGRVYGGELKRNEKHGEGIYYELDGTCRDGEWRFDKFMEGTVTRGEKSELWRNGKVFREI